MLKPIQQHAALQRDIETANPGDGLVLWWLGQSGFLIKSAAGVMLLDPYLSDSLTVKYEHSETPHIRMTEIAIRPSDLRGIDIVSSSHNHTDHFDAETLLPLMSNNPQMRLIIPEANRAFVTQRLGCDTAWPIGLDDGASFRCGDLEVSAIAAAHNDIAQDEQGRCHYLGYVVRLGKLTVYHAGDTLRYPGMADKLRPFQIDVAIVPINGNRPERLVSGNLFGDQAAQLASDIAARVAIPCHYNMFTFNTETTELFERTCRDLGQPYRVLQCGERWSLSPATG